MKNAVELKNMVKDKYGEIAKARDGSCCGPTNCCDPTLGVNFAEGYQDLDGYVPDADLSLGCGLPVPFAGISEGDTVLDLGSGAGNDVFVARAVTGTTGRVIGVDMVPDMIRRAEANAANLEYGNVEFRLGEIEAMPLEDAVADVVLSNCVLNLVPDKVRAYAEIHRVLKPGGHFCVSDVVLTRTLPPALAAAAELYVGCVAGALPRQEYLGAIRQAGFQEAMIRASRPIRLPTSLMAGLPAANNIGLESLTVVGYK